MQKSLRSWLRPLLLSSALLLSTEASAQQILHFSTGTGFYVSRNGHLVTNAHVLQQCSRVFVRESGKKPIAARIISKDDKLDLAIIQATQKPGRISALRHQDTSVQPGEQVTVIGYPKEHSQSGTLYAIHSRVRALTGPMGEDRWLQFEDAAQQGNSGGPLLDASGNVVGVVTGKATVFRRNQLAARDEQVSQSDVAINLPILKRYLQQNGVYFQTRDSLMKISDYLIEREGHQFVVQVMCQQTDLAQR